MFFNKLRLRYGLHWKRQRPDTSTVIDFIKNLMLILMIIAIYGLVGAMDYADAKAVEAEKVSQMLVDCMNGTARFLNDTQTELVVCEKAWSTKL